MAEVRKWWVGAARPPKVSLVSDADGLGSIVIETPEGPDEQDDENGASVYEEGSDTTYRVTVERRGNGDPFLTSLRIIPTPGGRITRATLGAVDPAALALAAQQYLDHARRKPDEWVVVSPNELRPVRGELPNLHALARKVNGGATPTSLVDEYGVSRATVYRWIAAARKAGHLASDGSKSPNGGRRSGQPKKDQK